VSHFQHGTRVHIVGVGGAGMSGLARLLLERGCVVSGSDATSSRTLEELAASGVHVSAGHSVANLPEVDVVTWSPAVASDNVEVRGALERGATPLTRAEVLADLVEAQSTIGLTGTHGKTTATSMMAHVFAAARRDPSRLVGAAVRGLGPNGHWGPDGLLLEVDESYGTFDLVRPAALGVLNVDVDHLDHYGTPANLEAAFARLIERTAGPVVAWDDPGARRAAALAARDVIWVGPTGPEWRVNNVVLERRAARFTLDGVQHLEIGLAVTGAHNVADAAVVAVLALAVGVNARDVVDGLARFEGAPRRFEYRGRWRGADVYEDYAHLPTEVRAALAGARAAGYSNVTAVFQPHRFSRTRHLAGAFGDSFVDAQRVIVTDVYAAGEVDPGDVSGRLVLEAIRRAHPDAVCDYVNDPRSAMRALEALDDPGDAVVLIGAGDIGEVAGDLVEVEA
jgi:UDP-N-acetylmuramate--alanine ligase